MSDALQIVRIKISNIMGIEELDFHPGQFNLIEAANGCGKTSFIASLKSLIERSDDATLLRRGATSGEVVLVLDDGTEIKRRITERGQPNMSIRKDGVKVARPTEVMDAIADLVATNPIEFVNARKKDRVNLLLETIPVHINFERLSEVAGHRVDEDKRFTPFDQIDALRQQFYDERTGTNRALTEKRHTIDQLAQTLPASEQGCVPEDKTGLLGEINTIDEQRDGELKRIDDKIALLRSAFDQTLERVRAAADSHIATYQEQIRALEKQIADRRQERDAEIQNERAAFAVMESNAEKQRNITRERHATARGTIAAKLADIEARSKQAARYQQTRETIARLEEDSNSLDNDSNRQSAAIEGIDNYKSELLASLPVPGLEVRGGEIYRHGIPFDRLNTAQQIEIAVEIAKLRVGKLAIVCVDGIERLDAAHFENFRDQMRAAGLQAFVTRVANNEELELQAA